MLIDGPFVLVYGTLFANCVARLFTGSRSRLLVLVPSLAAGADLIENV